MDLDMETMTNEALRTAKPEGRMVDNGRKRRRTADRQHRDTLLYMRTFCDFLQTRDRDTANYIYPRNPSRLKACRQICRSIIHISLIKRYEELTFAGPIPVQLKTLGSKLSSKARNWRRISSI
jgi:hypothetical protein